MKNMIRTHLTDTERREIEELLTQIEAKLAGKTVVLTEDERKRYGAINEQNKLFVGKVRDYRQNNPALSSPDVDWDEFELDYQSRQFFERIGDRFDSLSYQIHGTRILHDHDVHRDSLNDFAYTRYKKDASEPGYTEKAAEMSQFFNRSGTSKKNDPPPTE